MFTFRHFCTLAAVHLYTRALQTPIMNRQHEMLLGRRCIITIIPADANTSEVLRRRDAEMQVTEYGARFDQVRCTAAASRGQIKMSYDSRRCFAALLLSHPPSMGSLSWQCDQH